MLSSILDSVPRGDREFVYTDKDFDHIRHLIYKHSGISLSAEKYEMVYSRLARRLRKLNLNSFSEYREILNYSDNRELQNFINSVTTNLTAFFREEYHFDYLRDVFLPSKKLGRSAARGLKVWSAGCSSGEEALSIAITLAESIGDLKSAGIKIFATDIDTDILNVAKNAVYSINRIDGLPKKYLYRYFLRGVGGNQDKVKAKKNLTDSIYYKELNLVSDFVVKEKYDIIFCRNVAIYFDKQTQYSVYRKLGACLNDDGVLVIGHSESLHYLSQEFQMMGKTLYRKCSRSC